MQDTVSYFDSKLNESKVENLKKEDSKYHNNHWYRALGNDTIMYHRADGKGFGLNAFGFYVENAEWMSNKNNGDWEIIEFNSREAEEQFEKEFYTKVIIYLIKKHQIYHLPHFEITIDELVKSVGGMEKLKDRLGIDLNCTIVK